MAPYTMGKGACQENERAPTTLAATTREDLVCPSDTPVHGGVFEASGENHLAAGLDNVAGGA